jgi:Tripartite tricarboxylate transporter family receptor
MKNRKREICTSGSVRDEDGQPPHLLGRRKFLHLAAGAAALPALSRIASAQAYPTRPVRLIIGIVPGSGPDIVGRLLGQWLSDRLGQPFIVENRPGAGTNIATEAVVRSPADGYTLLLVTGANAINATLYEKLNFKFISDIAPVASISRETLALEVNPSFPAKTVPEFIAHARANPGKLSMASPGGGTVPHMAGELFKMMAGVDLVHVPYRGRARRVRMRCRTFQLWAISCRATRRPAGSASACPGARQPKSSISLTRRSTPLLLIPKSRRGSQNLAACQCR